MSGSCRYTFLEGSTAPSGPRQVEGVLALTLLEMRRAQTFTTILGSDTNFFAFLAKKNSSKTDRRSFSAVSAVITERVLQLRALAEASDVQRARAICGLEHAILFDFSVMLVA